MSYSHTTGSLYFLILFSFNDIKEHKTCWVTSFKFVLTFADIYFQVTLCCRSELENSIYINQSQVIQYILQWYNIHIMTACHAMHISKNKEFVLLFICFSNCVLLAYSKTFERKRSNTWSAIWATLTPRTAPMAQHKLRRAWRYQRDNQNP